MPPYARTHTHTLTGYRLQGGSLCWRTHTQSRPSWDCQRDPSPVTERNNLEGLCVCFCFLKSSSGVASVQCFVSSPSYCLCARQFYGYCEVLLPWKCSVWLDFTFSSQFPRNPATASNWLGAPGEFPPKVPLTSVAHNLNETICLWAAVKNFCFLSDARIPVSRWVWLSLSASFFPPLLSQNSPQPVSPSHNGLFVDSLHRLLFSGGVQAAAAHTAQPEPGCSERRATQGQGKKWSLVIWTVTPVRGTDQVMKVDGVAESCIE